MAIFRYGDEAPVVAQCPHELQPLFRSVAKNYPASGMLDPSANRRLTLEEKQLLAEGFPALHEVAARSSWLRIPEKMLPLLRVLRRKSCAAASCTEVGALLCDEVCKIVIIYMSMQMIQRACLSLQLGDGLIGSPHAEVDHVFMPAFPLLRGLLQFAADLENKKDGESCNKFARRHSQLTPGLFTVFCAHGICLGFKLMMNKESPKTAFDILFTRFSTGTCPATDVVNVQ